MASTRSALPNTQNLQQFQQFLYTNIPLVKHMQLKLEGINSVRLSASAPLAPNINDKSTVFGGSSAALMTICGWSLIKFHLQSNHINNDVVIQQSELVWSRAQYDNLIIHSRLEDTFNWADLTEQLTAKNKAKKVQITNQIFNQNKQLCSEMKATYVILRK